MRRYARFECVRFTARKCITADRLRFDFNHDKLTPEEKQAVEDKVNAWIDEDLPVSFAVYPTSEALNMGAIGAFGERYGDEVKVYSIGKDDNIVSFYCGSPHTSSYAGVWLRRWQEAIRI